MCGIVYLSNPSENLHTHTRTHTHDTHKALKWCCTSYMYNCNIGNKEPCNIAQHWDSGGITCMYLAIVYHLHGGHLPVRTGSGVNVAYRQGPILHRASWFIWPELAAGQLNQINTYKKQRNKSEVTYTIVHHLLHIELPLYIHTMQYCVCITYYT